MLDLSYEKAIENAEHLKAIGHTTIHLYQDLDGTNIPWEKISRISGGGSYRLSGPVSFRVEADVDGLTFTWSVDFETRDANGRGVSLFDRDRLREIVTKLPPPARESFAKFLRAEVLGGLSKRTDEIRRCLRAQADSEDCVRGLIAFAEAEPA